MPSVVVVDAKAAAAVVVDTVVVLSQVLAQAPLQQLKPVAQSPFLVA